MGGSNGKYVASPRKARPYDEHVTPTSLRGVVRTQVDLRADERGSFGELWRNSWTEGLGLEFVQANISRSSAGVMRGLHFHERQWDLWVFLAGHAQVALVDLRERIAGSTASPPTLVEELGEGQGLLIPPGVAHGFWALDEVSLLYLVTNEYDGTDEHGFAWNDPLAAVAWPGNAPILSERDAAAPLLRDVVPV